MSGPDVPPSARPDGTGRLAAVYRAIRRNTAQLDLQILGKVRRPQLPG